MVKGLDKFRAKFGKFSDQYTLIGGAACEMVMVEVGMGFRTTKDLDIVLTVEALTEEFATTFWEFVKEGGYEHQYKGTEKKQFYRFLKPTNDEFPFMLELFSREPDAITLGDDSHLTPVPTEEGIPSLSAILLSDDYYNFINAGRRILNEIPIVGAEHLLSLKAKAWCELTKRAEDGEKIDSREIKKHRNDVFRLFTVLNPDFGADLPGQVKTDLIEFLERVAGEEVALKQLGVKDRTLDVVINEIREIYGLN